MVTEQTLRHPCQDESISVSEDGVFGKKLLCHTQDRASVGTTGYCPV